MTTMLAQTIQVHRSQDGLVAQCVNGDLALRGSLPSTPTSPWGTVLQHHPAAPDAVHRPEVPAWRAAAAWPAAAA